MVNDPIAEMEKWFFVPHVKRVLVHFEGPHDIAETIQKAKQTEWEVGLVLNPGTPTTVIGDFVNDIDLIMFMGVYPGFQGQEFIPETCNRIAETKAKGIAQPISVDGGVNEKTIPTLIKAGVDIICPGSAVFGNDKTPAENVLALQRLIAEVSA
jgi:ribulose-phosphate 3-epimerase